MLSPGDVFHVGEQFLRFDEPPELPHLDGTTRPEFGGTPPRAWKFRLTQLLLDETSGSVHCSLRSTMTIGRVDCDVSFPHDVYLTAEHCRIERKEYSYHLVDMKSRNGTFIRLKGPALLDEGELFLVGRQLLRVEAL